MKHHVTFTIPKSKLLQSLLELSKISNSSQNNRITIEVTIIHNIIKLVIPGVELNIEGVTSGSAKAIVQLWYLQDIIENIKDKIIIGSISNSLMRINGLDFVAKTTFFDTDKILRSIKIPVNYTIADIAHLYLSEKYTPEEIEFNNLSKKVKEAMHRVNVDIAKSKLILSKYKVTQGEIEKLILKKLK